MERVAFFALFEFSSSKPFKESLQRDVTLVTSATLSSLYHVTTYLPIPVQRPSSLSGPVYISWHFVFSQLKLFSLYPFILYDKDALKVLSWKQQPQIKLAVHFKRNCNRFVSKL